MRMVILAVIAAVVFEVFVVVFAASADKRQVRAMPKWAWVLVVIFVPVLGGLAYLAFGRPIPGEAPYRANGQSKPQPKQDSGKGVSTWLNNFLGLEDENPGPNVAPQFRYREEPKKRKGPVAPDDDPEFLRKLDEMLKKQSSDEPEVSGDETEGEKPDELGEAQ